VFTSAGGVPASCIARWDGTSWSPLGSGLSQALYPPVGNCLAVLPNGTLLVGGAFDAAGGVWAYHIAAWDGTAWSSLNSIAFFTYVVNAIAVEANGNIVVGSAGYLPNPLVRWDGTTWSHLLQGFGANIGALMVLPNGGLLVGGTIDPVTASVNNLALLDNVWSEFGGTNGRVRTMLLLPDGEVVVGGDFTTAGGAQAALVARAVPTCPAGASLLPTSCVGPAGPLTLAATTRPFLGATFRARASGFATTAFGASVLGFGTVNLPLTIVDPAALPGCDLLVSPDVVQLVVPTAGQTTQQLVVPNTPTLVGATFSHQVVQFDAPGTPAWSVSSSNGLTLVVGAL
jgi:Domain of unknown function (DUF5122) beta-propeller